MTIVELYQLVFEKIFEEKGYEKPTQVISEIFSLIDEKATNEEEWGEYAGFTLDKNGLNSKKK